MEPLGDRLKRERAPQVEVPDFRRRLRRDLLDAHPGGKRPGVPYRTAAFAASGVALVMTGILVLFIARPLYPLQLHFALSARNSVLPSGPRSSALLNPEPSAISTTAISATAGLDGEATPASLSRDDPRENPWEDALRADRDLVRSWARQTYAAQPVSIESIHEPEAYTVSSFRLNNGKYVQIHTRVPQWRRVQEVSY